MFGSPRSLTIIEGIKFCTNSSANIPDRLTCLKCGNMWVEPEIVFELLLLICDFAFRATSKPGQKVAPGAAVF